MSLVHMSDRRPEYLPMRKLAEEYGLGFCEMVDGWFEGKYGLVLRDDAFYVHVASFIAYRCAYARAHGRRNYWCV